MVSDSRCAVLSNARLDKTELWQRQCETPKEDVRRTKGVFLVMTRIAFVPVKRDFSVNTDS